MHAVGIASQPSIMKIVFDAQSCKKSRAGMGIMCTLHMRRVASCHAVSVLDLALLSAEVCSWHSFFVISHCAKMYVMTLSSVFWLHERLSSFISSRSLACVILPRSVKTCVYLFSFIQIVLDQQSGGLMMS